METSNKKYDTVFTNPMMLSQRPVKKCSPLHKYIFPARLAHDVDIKTGKHCVVISINGVRRYIPVEEPVELSQEEWLLLNSIGGYLPSNFEYDPIRKP